MYKIKTNPSDFIVDEMLADGMCASESACLDGTGNGKYVWLSIKKTSWSTLDLARHIAKLLRVNEKRVNYAGIKDRNAVTYQVFSVCTDMYTADIKRIINGVKDVEMVSAWRSDRWIKGDDIAGNKFKIIVRGHSGKINTLSTFPNYFGDQRFGVKANTDKVGELIVKEKLDDAMHEYYGHCVSNPKQLLLKNKRLFKFCVHAFQSRLFNEELSMRIEDGNLGVLEGEYACGTNGLGFADTSLEGSDYVVTQLIGYKVNILNEYKRLLLDKYGVSTSQFRVLDAKGGWRTLYAPVVNLNYERIEDEIHFMFALQKGSYATVLLKELLSNNVR